MKNLLSLLEGELTDGRATLEATSFDVTRAATVCSENYLKGSREGKLDNTMSMATWSLGTVAFHISGLANHFISAMNLQSDIIAEICDRISKLTMIYNIHQEKVARKAIGSCTAVKTLVNYTHENVHPEPVQKYIRQPIDFTQLESIGHGVRTQPPPAQYGMDMNNSVAAAGTMPSRNFSGKQPNTISVHTSKAHGEYAASMGSSASGHYQAGTMGRAATIFPPHHLFTAPGPHFKHVSDMSASTGSGTVSPVIYARGAAGVPMACVPVLDSPNAGPVMKGHSGRSSGSSSVSSSTHYASNAPMQPGYAPQMMGVASTPVCSMPFVRPMALTTSTTDPNHHRMSQQYVAPTPVYPTVAFTGSTNSQIPSTLLSRGDYGVASQYSIQSRQPHHQGSAVMRGPEAPGRQEFVNSISSMPMQNPAQASMTYAPASKAPVQSQASDLMAEQNNMPLPPPEAYAESDPTTFDQDGTLPGKELLSTQDGERLIARKPSDPPWAPPFYKNKVRTLYEYVQDKDDELTFTENQIIYVVKKNDDGWWEGIMNGITGLFPGNYIEVLE